MSWPALLGSLVAALEADVTIDAQVLRGARAEVFGLPTLIVSRRGSSPQQATDWAGGAVRLWIECWHYDTDTAAADEALDALERAVQASVGAWLAAGPLAGLVVTGQITDILGDEDSFRPSVGSRLALDLAWRELP